MLHARRHTAATSLSLNDEDGWDDGNLEQRRRSREGESSFNRRIAYTRRHRDDLTPHPHGSLHACTLD